MSVGRVPDCSGEGGLEVELLVLVLVALHGPRARALLAGLAPPSHRQVRAGLARTERLSRAERHAALSVAFSPAPPPPGTGADVPGVLGERVRAALGLSLEPGPGPSAPLERWARRLARELADGPHPVEWLAPETPRAPAIRDWRSRPLR
jgi:hypothetical protein